MKSDKLIVSGKEYPVFIYLEKRTTSRVSIGKTGVHIRLPTGLSREVMWKEIIRFKQWAVQKLIEHKPIYKEKGSKIYNGGDVIVLGNGEQYSVRIKPTDSRSSSAFLKEKEIYLHIAENLSDKIKRKHASVLISRVIGQHKKQYITNKVRELNNEHFNFEVGKIFVKFNQSNWGSCSIKNNINISTRLFFAPEEVIEYVIVHELAHIKEKNHSQAFWSLVSKAIPDYKIKQQWLKENSDRCWF